MRSPLSDGPAIQELVLSFIFVTDMLLRFRVAYRDQEQLVTDPSKIAQRYLRCTTFPLCT